LGSIPTTSTLQIHVAPAALSSVWRIHSDRSIFARFDARRMAINSDLLTRSFSNIPRAFEAGSFGLPRTVGAFAFMSVRFGLWWWVMRDGYHIPKRFAISEILRIPRYFTLFPSFSLKFSLFSHFKLRHYRVA
jgi:hypothetical protein